jgi:hypothetical protein
MAKVLDAAAAHGITVSVRMRSSVWPVWWARMLSNSRFIRETSEALPEN